MKKLWTILVLCLVCAFCTVGFAACGGDKTEPEPAPAPAPAPTSEAMTKDEFLAELAKREAATFADTSLHYATVDCKLVLSEGDAEYDGTYEQTCDITYGTDQYEENFAYTSVKTGKGNNTRGQQQRLFYSDYFNKMFESVPADILLAFKFEKDGDDLKLLCDTEFNGINIYMEYEFDINGYLKYRKESESDGTTGESIEFTAKTYNRTKDLEVDAFLTYLRGLETYSYNNVRYATLTAKVTEKQGANPEITETKDFELEYRLDGEQHQIAKAKNGVTVLGLSWLMEEYVENVSDGEYAVKKVGSNYDVVATFDSVHISILHFIFDKDGYLVYYLEQEGDAYMVEMTATSYNKASGATVDYTVTEEQWDKAVSLYWTNVTYEFTDGSFGNKVELLEDGSLHQYAGVGRGWGEFYVIYRNSKWQVYQGSNTTPNFEYDTPADYIAGSYGDDFGFMQSMLPMIRGRMDEFTFDSANNQYLAENIGIQMGGPEDVYPMNVTAKFENQKLVYVKFAAVGGDEYMEANFWNYGTTVINYPDYILNGSEEQEQDNSEQTVVCYEFTSPAAYESYLEGSYIELSEDNTVNMRYVSGTMYSGTYDLDGNNISISAYSGGGAAVFLNGVIDGDVLRLNASGTELVYTKSAN